MNPKLPQSNEICFAFCGVAYGEFGRPAIVSAVYHYLATILAAMVVFMLCQPIILEADCSGWFMHSLLFVYCCVLTHPISRLVFLAEDYFEANFRTPPMLVINMNEERVEYRNTCFFTERYPRTTTLQSFVGGNNLHSIVSGNVQDKWYSDITVNVNGMEWFRVSRYGNPGVLQRLTTFMNAIEAFRQTDMDYYRTRSKIEIEKTFQSMIHNLR